MWKLLNSIHTFSTVAPPDGHFIYEQEIDTFLLTDKFIVNDSICNIEIPQNTRFVIDRDMVRFSIKVPVFYFLNSAINNFRMVKIVLKLMFIIKCLIY